VRRKELGQLHERVGAYLDPPAAFAAQGADDLKRMDTVEAESALFDYLLMARWCPITNRASTH